MHLRKKRTPRASQHYVGWRAEQKSLLLPVAGEVFLLTLPFIERGNRNGPTTARVEYGVGVGICENINVAGSITSVTPILTGLLFRVRLRAGYRDFAVMVVLL
jgi:hypothetical protein